MSICCASYNYNLQFHKGAISDGEQRKQRRWSHTSATTAFLDLVEPAANEQSKSEWTRKTSSISPQAFISLSPQKWNSMCFQMQLFLRNLTVDNQTRIFHATNKSKARATPKNNKRLVVCERLLGIGEVIQVSDHLSRLRRFVDQKEKRRVLFPKINSQFSKFLFAVGIRNASKR